MMMLQGRLFRSPFIEKRTYLRLLAAAVLTLCMAAFVGIALFITQYLHHSEGPTAIAGYMDLSGSDLRRSPMFLNGQWEWLGSADTPAALGEYVSFPVGSITQATKSATYRLRFSLPSNTAELPLFLSIPNFDGPLRVTLNGILLEPLPNDGKWVSYRATETIYPLTSISHGGQVQELVLSEDFSQEDLTLYKRPIVLGTQENINTLVLFDGSNEMFLVGILILVLINGFVFMLFRPTHRIISMMTLFDTTIMLRVVFSMNYMLSFIKSLMPGVQLSDNFAASAKLFVLMLGGIMGCLLSGALYDPKNEAPRWLIIPTPYIYAAFAIIFPLNLEFFEQYGRFLLFLTYGYTFLGVAWQFYHCWRNTGRETRVYYIMQLLKTVYIGILVFIDIFLWTEYFDFMLLFYLYGIFFILHVLVRLYDNNQSYRSVEILNQTLESTVAERTQELSEANRVLSELSIRDPLTKIFNRLYFESAAERAFGKYLADGTPIHLCMLDLDHFKEVNDTYGHDVGDEQLQRLAKIVGGLIDEDTVFARIGGEEFILLFQGKDGTQVLDAVQAIHDAIRQDAQKDVRHTTASFGIASLSPGQTIKSLLKQADLALYEAKNNGRNQIVVYDTMVSLEKSGDLGR